MLKDNLPEVIINNESSLRAAWTTWEEIEYYLTTAEDVAADECERLISMQISIERASDAYSHHIDENGNYLRKE